MRKIITVAVFALCISSCADQSKRQKYLEKMYPNCKIEPATGLVQERGFDFIIIDNSYQIIAVDFYIGSESKISRLRNIR